VPRRLKIFSRCEGAAAVEFAFILPLLVFLILGGMDFGDSFYIKHLITNASREGARYGANYTGITPAPTAGQISDYIKLPPPGLNYNAYNLNNLTVNTAYAGSFPNKVITVTVTADKHWWILGSFNFYGWIGLTDPQKLTGTTAMNVEH
jgi:Flp pilus assembly protein TadG